MDDFIRNILFLTPTMTSLPISLWLLYLSLLY
jgi:hypothetical protein